MKLAPPVLLVAALSGFATALAVRAQEAAPAAREQAPPDVPAGDARIEGRVLQGAQDRPVPGVEVVLYALSADGTPGLRRVRSDANGAFTFDGVSSMANVAYLIGARHRDIPVPGGRVAFAPGQRRATADIRVADLTSDTSGVRLRTQTLRLFREAQGLRIEETFELELPGDEIAYVPPRERRRRAPGLAATLPAGASDFQMPLGVIPEGLVRAGAAQRYFGPFYPGGQELTWSYRVASEEATEQGQRFRFEFTPAVGVETFSVLVPESAGAFDAPGLANAGRVEDGGRTVTRFTAAHPKLPLTFSLLAPPARVDPSAISVREVQIVLHADDAAISVSETHLVAASGDGLLLGTPATPLLRVPIPPGASDVRFGSEAPGLAFAPGPDGAVAVTGSLSPGEVPVQIAYRVPVSPAGARLARSFGAPVALLRIFVADTGRLLPASPRLHRTKPVRTEDLNYLGLEAFDVEAGEEVNVALDPLPPRGGASPALARGLAALGGLALLAWVALPFRARAGSTASADAGEPRQAEREAIYQAIRDLDHDFETGKVSADDHARLRESLRLRAAALIRAEASAAARAVSGEMAGASHAPPATPAPADLVRACGQCGAATAPEHRFCPSCGAPLGAPAA